MNIAHIDKRGDEWIYHPLQEHLTSVADLAAQFAIDFQGQDWARLAGLLHDLGKYHPRFQAYIRGVSGYHPDASDEEKSKQPHSNAGALFACNEFKFGKLLAYLIAGHHAGLPNGSEGGKASLDYRLGKELKAKEELAQSLAGLNGPPDTQGIQFATTTSEAFKANPALWLRLVFSCLVDADYLDTEAFMKPETTKLRSDFDTIDALFAKIDQHITALNKQSKPTPLNTLRSQIATDCLAAAELKPGVFSLTVPTGGGKTLSSLAFALKHAKCHQKRRVIYAIPYTSIIEQTANVFRDVLGTENVVEHHSNLAETESPNSQKQKLASENWDAPVIVTTNVQFFESLFAAHPSRCRKLHRIVNSVVVLDEAQMLPRAFLKPITELLATLASQYGVTVLLCTATQPALGPRTDSQGIQLLKGLAPVQEINQDTQGLFNALRRVRIHPHKDWKQKSSAAEVAELALGFSSVLVIVNDKRTCLDLYQAINNQQDGHTFYLSTNVCAEHRSQILGQIKALLAERKNNPNAQPLRVISTQLIETGVDIDFPVVIRAMAGLDSLAQAAGRCNREGLLTQGEVIVYNPERQAPAGLLRQGSQTSEELLGQGIVTDLLAPDSYKHYFDLLYSKGDLDEKGITNFKLDKELNFHFRKWADDFMLIDEDTEAIVVPFVPENAQESPVRVWLNMLANDPSQRWIYRKLQRFTVGVHKNKLSAFLADKRVEPVAGMLVALPSFYSPEIGLLTEDGHIAPNNFLV